MADSLFDNRYRYDYIYPRGRSGETLRAVDTQDNDRPVVIKRPAPNDAPPIRAGQEVSISNERQALEQLAGHSVLTELLGFGQFFVGGMPHQYIVMERADGQIVAEIVAELAARGERMPELEVLVIMDRLLDLLHTAHSTDIVYNDVDAMHLFWNRDTYTLKAIDWGNTVFLEGDEVTPQGISRQSDIYQVGELLYFIFTGGKRAEIPRDAAESFRVDFGDDERGIHSRLQEIISKALHPNTKLRYQSLNVLRNDLAHYRDPMERERNAVVGRVAEKLRQDHLSKSELQALQTRIEPILRIDPGYPVTRQTHGEVVNRLRDLEVSADLDAVQIYMESSNWSRAADLLNELREKAGTQTVGIVRLLLDTCIILLDGNVKPVPDSVLDALSLVFDGHPNRAAQKLLLQAPTEEPGRSLSWRIAERLSAHIPEILLLRPNLFRLDTALYQLSEEGFSVSEARKLVYNIQQTLDDTSAMSTARLSDLRDSYRMLVDQLSALNPILQTISIQHQLSERRLGLNALDRALNAAMALADNMHVIGKQSAASPRDALAALDSSRSIDPINPVWDGVQHLLDNLYELLQSCQIYVPAADGSDLEAWLVKTRQDMEPFIGRLFDEMLLGMTEGLEIAETSWRNYRETVITGNRSDVLAMLTSATDAVGTISPTLAGWLNQLRNIVNGAKYIERHSIPGGLGRALADGWQAYDRGQLVDAERLGQQAYEIARTETGRQVAERLRKLSELTRNWVERNGINSTSRTRETLNAIEKLYTPDEKATLDGFSAQMPSLETYLRAMSKGLIEVFDRSSTAALRILFVNYVLLGAIDAYAERLPDAEFWLEAAEKVLETRHIAARTLQEFIQQRHDIATAATLLGDLTGKHNLTQLESSRQQLENNPQARLLAGGIQSLRQFEAALRDWVDGDFRAAGMKLESAINAVNDVEQAAHITLTGYRAWLMELQASVVELHVQTRDMHATIAVLPDDPESNIRDVHRLQVQVTEQLLGESYAATLAQWRDTYEAFLGVYTDPAIRRSKRLEQFNELFRAIFIDRHPAYPLYRHWYDVTERAPEFPAPETNDPVPQIKDDVDIFVDDSELPTFSRVSQPESSRLSRRMILGGIGIVVVVGLLLALVLLNNDDAPLINVPLTITDTPALDETGTVRAAAALTDVPPTATLKQSATMLVPTLSPTEADFSTPTLARTETLILPATATHTATDTAIPPTATLTHTATDIPTATHTHTPTLTYTPSNTPTSTLSPTPTLPPEGLQGSQDLLALFRDQEELPWNPEAFGLAQDEIWRLGTGEDTPGDVLVIVPPVEMLETAYGNQAASRIRRVEANLTLRTFNPAVVSSDDIFFGILLQSTADGNNAGIQIQAIQQSVINIGQVLNNEVDYLSQRAVNAVIVRLRIDRDLTTGALTLFLNDSQLGAPIDFIDPDASLVPLLFVKDGGVIVGVTDWRITLR